ncbi:MAG: hypothetical protein MK132_04400 [Lentisphaerales bacterium]|nr:hypothetical protein [Lentisphaerales bacterium]
MNQRSIAKRYFFITLILSFAYAFIRYFIFKEVSHTKIPLWITNKATSMAATILIVTSVLWKPDKPRKTIGLLGLFIGFLHSIMSLAMLNPAYYGKFFLEINTMTLKGELCMLAGILCLAALMMAAYYSFPAISNTRGVDLKTINFYVMLAIFLNLLHLVFMGWNTWIDIGHWPGYLPPVSLVAAFVCILGLNRKFIKTR